MVSAAGRAVAPVPVEGGTPSRLAQCQHLRVPVPADAAGEPDAGVEVRVGEGELAVETGGAEDGAVYGPPGDSPGLSHTVWLLASSLASILETYVGRSPDVP